MTDFKNFERLVDIMSKLRGPEGCPWDHKQTHETLKKYLIEETYEVIDAIEEGDNNNLKEELGDLLLQIVFHAQIANEDKRFDIEDVALAICDKLVRRHPHVFDDKDLRSAEEVQRNWDMMKVEEKAHLQKLPSVLDAISRHLPALLENEEISKKAAKLGFDWQRPENVLDKVEEEIREVRLALTDEKKREEELGDLLFAVANACRVYDINPELALKKANKKFRKRFAFIEKHVEIQKLKWEEINFVKWDMLWNEAKKS